MNDKINIRTNRHHYPLLALADLPKAKQADFDYIDEEAHYDPRIVKYRGWYYDVQDMQAIRPATEAMWPMGWAMHVELDHPFAAWQMVNSDSFFSGTLFRYADDEFETVQCATYTV